MPGSVLASGVSVSGLSVNTSKDAPGNYYGEAEGWKVSTAGNPTTKTHTAEIHSVIARSYVSIAIRIPKPTVAKNA